MKYNRFKKATFGKGTIQELISDEHIRFLEDVAETKGVNEARLREIKAIYNSLVGIAENQLEVVIEVPNGKWRFDANSELGDVRLSKRWKADRNVCVTCGHPNGHYYYCIRKPKP